MPLAPEAMATINQVVWPKLAHLRRLTQCLHLIPEADVRFGPPTEQITLQPGMGGQRSGGKKRTVQATKMTRGLRELRHRPMRADLLVDVLQPEPDDA